MTIEEHAAFHQRQAAHDHKVAAAALDCGYLDEARHHQWLAQLHHERAWMFLVSLLMRDPII